VSTPKPPQGIPKLPLVLLGLLTLVTFVGPCVAFMTLRGGEVSEWPPDRPVEWWAIGLTLGLGFVLTVACITTALQARSKLGGGPH
jgi:hypothetical protein